MPGTPHTKSSYLMWANVYWWWCWSKEYHHLQCIPLSESAYKVNSKSSSTYLKRDFVVSFFVVNYGEATDKFIAGSHLDGRSDIDPGLVFCYEAVIPTAGRRQTKNAVSGWGSLSESDIWKAKQVISFNNNRFPFLLRTSMRLAYNHIIPWFDMQPSIYAFEVWAFN